MTNGWATINTDIGRKTDSASGFELAEVHYLIIGNQQAVRVKQCYSIVRAGGGICSCRKLRGIETDVHLDILGPELSAHVIGNILALNGILIGEMRKISKFP